MEYRYEIEVVLDDVPLFSTTVDDVPALQNVYREISQQFPDAGGYLIRASEIKIIKLYLSPYEIYSIKR